MLGPLYHFINIIVKEREIYRRIAGRHETELYRGIYLVDLLLEAVPIGNAI